MALIVQKFGGSSVGTLDKIQHVANKVSQFHSANHKLVVVVSAMEGETSRLIAMAQSLADKPEPHNQDLLVSTGEQVTAALLTIALNQLGCPASAFTGGQIPIITDSAYGKARIEKIGCNNIKDALAKGQVAVVAGFQGVDSCNNITTLGRGGSDTTAVALATVLEADECQIYTDVDGVYTTDPRVVPEAQRLNKITVEEMLEMASLGAKVLQIRAVEFAGKYKVPLRVLHTFTEGPGTLIVNNEGDAVEQPIISGIAFNQDEAKLTVRGVPDIPGAAYKIIGPISEANIEVDMIVQNVGADQTTDFTFTVHRNDFDQAKAILEQTADQVNAKEVVGDGKIVKVSLIGVGMRSHAGIASQMFAALAKENINIQMISTSEIKISVVVAEKYFELAVRSLHSAFDLDQDEILSINQN